VREIYKLGIKHGMKLAEISGVNGPFSDEDIERVRELALVARAKQMQAPARKPARRAAPAKKAAPAKAAPRRTRAKAASTAA